MNVQQTIERALALHQTGQLAQAEAAYRQVLEVVPEHFDALHLLGVVASQTGRASDAVTLISRAVLLNPAHPFAHNNLGLAYEALGRLEDAATSYRNAIANQANFSDAHYNLGNVLQAQGKLEAASSSYRQAVLINPQDADAYRNLARVFHTQGKLDEAIQGYRKVLAMQPHNTDIQRELACLLQAKGELSEAAQHYQRVLEQHPADAESRFNLGVVLQLQNNFVGAVASYQQAVPQMPNSAPLHYNLAMSLRKLGQAQEAVPHYLRVLELDANNLDAKIELVQSYTDLGQFEAAQHWVDRLPALGLKAQFAHVVLQPPLRKMTLEDTAWLRDAQDVLTQPLGNAEKTSLYFALGKYYDDTRQYDLAFAAYSQGNQLKCASEGRFDCASFSALVDAIIADYDAAFVAQQHEGSSLSERPVFIVGMPRSGTSLTEQIIASHPAVFGAGELTFWSSFSSASGDAPDADATPEELAEKFASLLHRHSPDALRVIDKMPQNFLWLGLIHAVFPKARIIHIQRNALDNCLSIFFQHFDAAYSYGNDLSTLRDYYRNYLRLMAHWRAVLPAECFIEVEYEALTNDQEGWSRHLIEFLGLEWDERCLEFYKTERKVGTASNWQARQKIYHTSKARWRNYEQHVAPLLDLLESDTLSR